MLKGIFTVKSNENIAKDIYKMVLEGDTAAITAPGQFINIALDGFYLRRPISVCDFDSDTVTIIYKTVGRGTRYMSTLGSGARLDVLSGLGNGFDLAKGGAHPILLGGGIGNLIDRVLNGEVVDYINLLFMRFAVFNFADICVCVGVALWVLVIFLEELHSGDAKEP